MKLMLKCLALAVFCLSLPLAAMAGEAVPTAKEILAAEGAPPTIPHRVGESDTYRECLACHLAGKKGAPATSHPQRRMCSQCHVPGGTRAAAQPRKKR